MQNKTAEVNAIFPDRVSVTVYDLDVFQQSGESVRVGSYLRIVDRENAVLIAIVESFTVLTDLDAGELAGLVLEKDADLLDCHVISSCCRLRA